MYQNVSKHDDTPWLNDFNVSSLSMEEMFLKLSHKKEDFIIKYGENSVKLFYRGSSMSSQVLLNLLDETLKSHF